MDQREHPVLSGSEVALKAIRDIDPFAVWRGRGGFTVQPGAFTDPLFRLLLVELDESEHILPDETTDRPGTVLRDGDRSVRLDDKAGRLEETALVLEERAERLRRLSERERITHGKTERVLFHRLRRLLEGISRRGDDTDVLFFQLGSSVFESSQLLLAVRSPVSSVEQQDAPSVPEGVGKRERPVRNRVHGECGKRLTTVEDPRSCSCHQQLLSATPSVAAAGALLTGMDSRQQVHQPVRIVSTTRWKDAPPSSHVATECTGDLEPQGPEPSEWSSGARAAASGIVTV